MENPFLKQNKNEPGKVLSPATDEHLTEYVQQIITTQKKLKEFQQSNEFMICLVNDEALIHYNFALEKLSGTCIGPYDILDAYYNLEQMLKIRFDPRAYDVESFREKISSIQKILEVPYYAALIYDQKKHIRNLENLAQKTGNKFEVRDLCDDLERATIKLDQLKNFYKAALTIYSLRTLEAAGICKLGPSEEAI